MFKSFKQLNSFLTAKIYFTNRELKNLKLPPELHQAIKREAANHALTVTQTATALIALALTNDKAMTEQREEAFRSIGARRK